MSDVKSPEVSAPALPETPSTNPNQESTPVYQNTQKNISKFEKVLTFLKLKSTPKPIIEEKPGIAPGSEGRVKLNRDEVQKKLQQEPSAS